MRAPLILDNPYKARDPATGPGTPEAEAGVSAVAGESPRFVSSTADSQGYRSTRLMNNFDATEERGCLLPQVFACASLKFIPGDVRGLGGKFQLECWSGVEILLGRHWKLVEAGVSRWYWYFIWYQVF